MSKVGRALGAIFLALAGVWSIAIAARTALDLEGNDFGRMWYGTRAFLAGGSIYDETPATRLTIDGATLVLANLNPPHVHLLLVPLAGASLSVAYACWMAINALAIGYASWQIARRTRPSTSSPAHDVIPWWFAALALFASSLTVTTVLTGQWGGILMVPVTLAFLAARDDRDFASGAWLGLALAAKPFLAIVPLAWLFAGRWRALAGTLATVAASGVVGLLVFGPAEHARWLAELSDVSWHGLAMNASLMGLSARSLAPAPGFSPLVDAPALVAPIAAVLSVAIGVATLVRAPRLDPSRRFLALFSAALLAAPVGWIYYGFWLLGPLAAAWRERTLSRVVFLALPAALVPPWLLVETSGIFAATVGSLYSWGLLAIWIAAISPSPTDPV